MVVRRGVGINNGFYFANVFFYLDWGSRLYAVTHGSRARLPPSPLDV